MITSCCSRLGEVNGVVILIHLPNNYIYSGAEFVFLSFPLPLAGIDPNSGSHTIGCIRLLHQVIDFPSLLQKQKGVVEINNHWNKKNSRAALPLVAVRAAMRLASITVFLIYFAFCLNLSSFPFNSFSSLSISFLLSSISVAARQLLTSISSSGNSCKNE